MDCKRDPTRCVLQLLGRSDEALSLAQEGLRHAREEQNLFSLGHA